MLNFEALDAAQSNYKKTLINEADACGKEIKKITDKLESYDLPNLYYSWSEKGTTNFNGSDEETEFQMGLVWDSAKRKIFYWFDESDDLKVLAGENALIRASIRGKLSKLIDKATEELNTLTHEISSFISEDQSEEDIFGDPDHYEENSLQDRMMINGEQE